jgi:hypothetical protein
MCARGSYKKPIRYMPGISANNSSRILDLLAWCTEREESQIALRIQTKIKAMA